MKNITLEINGTLFDKLTVAENYEDMVNGQEKKTQIDDREGMVYVFSKDTKGDFVNENPILDLDVIMVDSSERITAIHTMKKAAVTEGKSEDEQKAKHPEYYSPTPYRYAFELKAGMAGQLKLSVGDHLETDYLQLQPFRNAENIRYAFQLKKITSSGNWIAPLLKRMEKIATSHDALLGLNIEFVGGQHDTEKLLNAGWSVVDGYMEAEFDKWLQKVVVADGQNGVARLYLSRKGHFRYLYFLPLAKDGSYLPENVAIQLDSVAKILRPDLIQTQIAPQPQKKEEELENVIWHLSNPSVKDEWSEDQKKFYIWSRELPRLNEKNRFDVYRLLNGMLRFDDFCKYDFVLSRALCSASDLKYRWAIARLVMISLMHVSKSCDPDFWNDLGVALLRVEEPEAAFNCFVNAWNLQFEPLYARNIWIVGDWLISDLREKQKWDSLFYIASAMLSAISDKATVKEQVEVLCVVGLIYEKRNDCEEAKQYYEAAYDIYKRESRDKKSFWELRWDFPILYQALMRIKMSAEKLRIKYVDAQLKTFPKTPLECGFDGRLPVEYVEGDGHGDHWDSVAKGRIKNMETFFETMIREGHLDFKGISLPAYERGDGLFSSGDGFRYSNEEDSQSPVESYFLIGVGKENYFASAFPVFKKGCGISIIRPLRGVNVWGNAIEATVEFDLRKNGENTLAFFLPNYSAEFLRLKPDTAYRVELGAFAYSVSQFEEREFKIDKGPMLAEEKLRLRKEGKDDNIDSVSIHMTKELCNISRSFSGWADDVSIVAPIARIEQFSFLGNECITLWLKFDERGADMTLPVFLRKGNLADGYLPKVGDVVDCGCWLQGWVHEPHNLSNATEVTETEDIDSDDDADGFDFENALLLGVRGTDYNLESLAVRAFEKKGKVEDLCRCPEALPGDADFSCHVNGEVKFAKVMTGYFENEAECREAWKSFCNQTTTSPDAKPVILLSVVGIKLCDDHYKIYYNGFAKLNSELSADSDSSSMEDELDLDKIPEALEHTPQEMAEIIANAWKNLDVSGIREILSDDYEYTSMWVSETMYGADKYLEYLSGKFESIRGGSNTPVVSEIRSDERYAEIELQQNVNGETNDLMLQFEIKDGKIISGWMGETSFRRVK